MWGDISLWSDLHFSDDYWCWTSLHMLICHLWFIFGEICNRFLSPFLNHVIWLLLFMCSSLYILDINHFSDIWFESIFSHYTGCIFVLLIVSFDKRKFHVWLTPICLFFLLLPVLWCHRQEIIAKSNVMKFLPCVPLKGL